MIEDIQKVNKLAQELLDQGVATSRDEAVEKAQQFLNKEITTDKQKVTSDNKVQVADLTLENLKNIFDRQKEMTQQRFNDFRSAINALADEISSIKKELKSRPMPEAKTAEDAGLEPEKKTGQVKLKPKQEEKESHPKRGNWKSEDVAIDKIFYFGNK